MLALTFICIINYISKTENDLWTLQFFDFLFYLMSFSAGNTIQIHSFYFSLAALACAEMGTAQTQLCFICGI